MATVLVDRKYERFYNWKISVPTKLNTFAKRIIQMIAKESIAQYKGSTITREKDCIYIPPCALLRPYISHYCISFPTPQTMSDEYTVLPSANSVLVISVKSGEISGFYNGTNSKASIVGDFANKNELLLLVKFQAGGFFSFYGFNQDELLDVSLDLSCIDKALSIEIEMGLVKTKKIDEMIELLDSIFLSRLKASNNYISSVINTIILRNGNITTHEISTDFYYSEKHIRRLFLQQVGVSVKSFSRIVRINCALQLLQNKNMFFSDVAIKTGFFDQPHFIHDFKAICGLTPQNYLRNMSAFYNYNFKL